MIDRDRLVKTFCDLVRIDSPSGEEEAVAVDLVGRLEALGLTVARDPYGNVIAREEGDDPILLSAHMDTVEPGRGVTPIVEEDRIVSDETTILGGDCKAGVSAILEALQSSKDDATPRRPVEVALTREEEIGLVGARNLDYSMLSAREAIVFDGEGPASQITSGSPTYIGFEIEVTGRSAHAGVEPEKGLSAIRVASEIVSSLPQGRLDRETTFNIGKIEGGQVRNAVPEKAVLTGEFRSFSLETLDGLQLQLSEAITKAQGRYPEAIIEPSTHTEFETYALDDSDPFLRQVKASLRGLGLEPVMEPSGGGTDGNVLRRNGISSVVVGMAVRGMHTRQESVSIPELVDAARLCESLLRERG